MKKLLCFLFLIVTGFSLTSSVPASRDEVLVPILACDFKDADYLDTDDCALSRACKRKFNLKQFSVGTSRGHSYNNDELVTYNFETYSPLSFMVDGLKSIFRGYNSSVIRVVSFRITKRQGRDLTI